MSADNEADKQGEGSAGKTANENSKSKTNQSPLEWHLEQSDDQWEEARRLQPSAKSQSASSFWRGHGLYWVVGLVGLFILVLPWRERLWPPPQATPTPALR